MEQSLSKCRVRRTDRRVRHSVLTAVCALFLLGLGEVTAAVLDPANISGTVFFNIPPPPRIDFNSFGTFQQAGAAGSLQFTATGTPAPSLSGQATVSQGFTGRVSGILIYGIEILGPDADVPVSIDVSGGATGSSLTNDPFAAFAMKSLWSLEDATLGLQPVFSEGIDTGQLSGRFSDNFSHTVDLTLTANHVYRVTMVADAFAAAGSGVSASATTFVVPVFSFGAGVGAEYSFLLSEGIGNSAPVPEPASFVLLIAGVLALSLVRTRRRLIIGSSGKPK